METNQTGPMQGKNPIEALSKEEIIEKYKGLLGIAKKAKQAKDELTEENRKLKDELSRSETQKEADKNALITMKEMVEEFTQNKLELATQLDVLQNKSRTDDEELEQLKIENESLKRQLDRLNDDNEALLKDIDQMEEQLKQVNLLGIEQKQHLSLLELEVNKLKEAESLNSSLQNQIIVTTEENKAVKEQQNAANKSLSDLKQKYQTLKETNIEQRSKFNALKDRFVDIYRKLKKLKECKRVLLETQYEYSEAISNWQKEIIEASRRLCLQFNGLKSENQILLEKLQNKEVLIANTGCQDTNSYLIDKFVTQLKELKMFVDKATIEHKQQAALMLALEEDNASLKQKLKDALLDNENLIGKIHTGNNEAEESSNTNLIDKFVTRVKELKIFVDKATMEHKQQGKLLVAIKDENANLKQQFKEALLDSENVIGKSCPENTERELVSELKIEIPHSEDLAVESRKNENENSTNKQVEEFKNNIESDFKNIDDLYQTNQKLIKELSEYRKETQKYEELVQKDHQIKYLKGLLKDYEEKGKNRSGEKQVTDELKTTVADDLERVLDIEENTKKVFDLKKDNDKKLTLEEHLIDLEQKDNANIKKIELLNTEKEELLQQVEQLSHLSGENKMQTKTLKTEESLLIQQYENKQLDNFAAQNKELEESERLEEKPLAMQVQHLKGLLKEYEEKENIFNEDQQENEELRSKGVTDLKVIENIDQQNKNFLSKLSELKTVNKERSKLQEQFEILLHKNEDNLNKLDLLNTDKEKLCEQVEKLNELLQENIVLKEELQQTRDIIKVFENERSSFIENKSVDFKAEQVKAEELELLRATLSKYSQTIEDLQLRYERKEREHADLLGEMRELNEALKARGDVISRQQESYSELFADIKQTTLKLQQIEKELNEKEQTIQTKDLQIHTICSEVDEARKKIADLEGSCFKNEEKLRQLNEELQQLRHHAEVQAAQDAQSEILSTSTISRAEELNRLREVDESFEEKYNKLRGLAIKLKKKLQEQTLYIAELEKRQSNSVLKTDLNEATNNLESLQLELEENKKQLEMHKNEIQKLKSSRKQANVLNLEIEAAEKSLSEATNKLTLKINEVETLTESVASKENTIIQLRKEINILEAAKEAECTHSKELKEQIDLLQRQIKDAVHSKQLAVEFSKEIEQSCESLKFELEETRLQLANITSQHEAALAVVTMEKQRLEVDLIVLQTDQRDTLAKLKTEERALEDLRVEYLDYKVKAQVVLRKNQNKDCTMQREQEEELLSLKTSEKQLRTAAELYQKRTEDSEREIELLKEENVSLQRRSKELMQLVNDLKQQNETMAQDQRHEMLHQQESLKQHRLQIESLDDYHKLQIKEIEIGYLKEIEELKVELSKAIRQPPVVGAAVKAAAQIFNTNPYNSSEQSKIDFLLMEREDAEGSEEAEALATAAANRKISTSSRRSQHDFMPLDELLNSPMNVISDSVTTITSASLGRAEVDNSHVELQATRELLQKQESRVRHLTSLLAENEQDLAKLTQMNDMLKEELRRQERAEEREKHLHNLEYLKNVVIKFCTLNNGDERTRLVPVLNTILKLSRSEAEMLSCAAKGQKVTTDANSNRGWGHFLPTWGNNN